LRFVLVAIAVSVSGGTAGAHLPPWVGPGEPPLPAWVKSARILKDDEPLVASPWAGAPRRGSAARDVRLPVFAARPGAGCKGRWLQVGPAAWACEDAVELSADLPVDPRMRTLRETSDGLPFRYHFVGPDGSFAYKRLRSADLEAPDMQLEPGFGVAIVEERSEGGARYGRTHNDLWIPMRDLSPARSLAFQGEAIAEGSLPSVFAWVVADSAKVFTSPQSFAQTDGKRSRFELVPLLQEAGSGASRFLKIGESAWLSARDVQRPSIADPPPEVNDAAGERWIDIDLATQTLVAYEGRRAVFATLVSTGKGREGSPYETPRGVHRIWIKLFASNMDNLEDESAARYYRMEDVPYVQYFSKGVGLHGVYWHRSFGHERSHGCVNLAPLDAQRLFWWTSPRMPAGWTAVLPGAYEPGTVVRVR
jgi:hypothetical protein